MVNSPVFSAPVQRALAGAAATGGAVQSLNHNIWMTSEGADQSLSSNGGWFGNPSEGAEQATAIGGVFGPSEGADQATAIGGVFGPSEGADQATAIGGVFGPSEGADQALNSYDWYPSEGAVQGGTHTIWGPSEG